MTKLLILENDFEQAFSQRTRALLRLDSYRFPAAS
jgi:hypothetical protein